MLPWLGLATVLLLLAAILSKRVSPLAALVCFPVAASLVGGFGLQTGRFILAGIQGIAPVIGMFVFAILFFGIMTDTANLGLPCIDAAQAQKNVTHNDALRILELIMFGSMAVFFIVLLVLMAVLVFLYAKTQRYDESDYFENVASLRHLKQLDAQWELDVLKSRIGITGANGSSVIIRSSPDTLVNTRSRAPSPLRSPAANPREMLGVPQNGEFDREMSANLPFPSFRKSWLRSL